MRVLTAVSMALACLAGASHAQRYDQRCPDGASIATGTPTGNYFDIGRDIAEMGAELGIAFQPLSTAGSIENGDHVDKRPCTPMGIVQHDYLHYLKTNPNGGVRPGDNGRISRRMVAALPLYLEFVHILARREIRDFSDLEGKIISIGPPDSGSNLTATLLLQEWGVPLSTESLPTDRALQDLKDNLLDATVFVTGHWSGFSEIGPELGLKLISPPPPPAGSIYEPAVLEAAKYPGLLERDLNTVGVRATLMTFRWGQGAYSRESCERVQAAVNLIRANFDCLQENGNENWRRVDLAALPGGWDQSPCARRDVIGPQLRALRSRTMCGPKFDAAGPFEAGSHSSERPTSTVPNDCRTRCADYRQPELCITRCLANAN